MNPSLRVRLLTRADLPFADSVRSLAGWNQTGADWERFLTTEPNGCYLAEWAGAPAGTATTTVYGPKLAWIGMVLVHPDYRRRGIGRALLQHCVEYLRSRGVLCLKLDATPLGKTVYDGLGFQAEWTLARWSGVPLIARPRPPGPPLRPWQSTDKLLVDPLDAAAFGVSRRRILPALVEQSVSALVSESKPGHPAGFGLLRHGSRALYLGPVAATSTQAGIELVEALVARSEGQAIFWDIPVRNAAAVAWAEQHGFTNQRPLIRMFLGQNLVPGDPERQFALAGPETG